MNVPVNPSLYKISEKEALKNNLDRKVINNKYSLKESNHSNHGIDESTPEQDIYPTENENENNREDFQFGKSITFNPNLNDLIKNPNKMNSTEGFKESLKGSNGFSQKSSGRNYNEEDSNKHKKNKFDKIELSNNNTGISSNNNTNKLVNPNLSTKYITNSNLKVQNNDINNSTNKNNEEYSTNKKDESINFTSNKTITTKTNVKNPFINNNYTTDSRKYNINSNGTLSNQVTGKKSYNSTGKNTNINNITNEKFYKMKDDLILESGDKYVEPIDSDNTNSKFINTGSLLKLHNNNLDFNNNNIYSNNKLNNLLDKQLVMENEYNSMKKQMSQLNKDKLANNPNSLYDNYQEIEDVNSNMNVNSNYPEIIDSASKIRPETEEEFYTRKYLTAKERFIELSHNIQILEERENFLKKHLDNHVCTCGVCYMCMSRPIRNFYKTTTKINSSPASKTYHSISRSRQIDNLEKDPFEGNYNNYKDYEGKIMDEIEKRELFNDVGTTEDILGQFVDRVIDRSLYVYKNRNCHTCAKLLSQGKSTYHCPKHHHLYK